jgi:transcriptional regulator of heat shock response
MDPLSITATCVGLASSITRTSLVVISFVKDVRSARSDLDVISRELSSLKTILELLTEDVSDSTTQSIPQTLQKQITGIVTNCTEVVVDIEKTLVKHEGGKMHKAAKWVASGKSDVAKLQLSLEAHKSALEIALDMVAL